MIRISEAVRIFFRGNDNIDPNVILSLLDYNKEHIEHIFRAHFLYDIINEPESYGNVLKLKFRFRSVLEDITQTINQDQFRMFPEFFENFLFTVYSKINEYTVEMPSQDFIRYRQRRIYLDRNSGRRFIPSPMPASIPIPVSMQGDFHNRSIGIDTGIGIDRIVSASIDVDASHNHLFEEPLHESFIGNSTRNNDELTPEKDEDDAYADRIGV